MNEAARAGLEAGFALFLLAAGVLIAYISWGYGFGSLERPGPGLYPFFVGSAIALFAAILLGSLLQRPPRRSPLSEGASRTVLFMSLTFCAWILAMPVLGYVIVTALATYVFCKTLKLEGWRKPAVIAVGTALFIYLLFDKWLYIDLPRGFFGP
jgi:hypothetical protein